MQELETITLPCRLDKFITDGLEISKFDMLCLLDESKIEVHSQNRLWVANRSHRQWLVFPGTPEDKDGDVVTVQGVPVTPKQNLSQTIVYALNKPKNLNVLLTKIGVPESNLKQMQRRSCFATWLEDIEHECNMARKDTLQGIGCKAGEIISRNTGTRLFNIGRLDKKTTGLIFVTNNGDLSYLLCTPHAIDKEYVAYVKGKATEEQMKQLVSGVELCDGLTNAVVAEIVCSETKMVQIMQSKKRKHFSGEDQQNEEDAPNPSETKEFEQSRSQIKIVVRTGKNRVVRRLLAAVGLPVLELQRTRIGSFTLENLGLVAESSHTALSPEQVEELWTQAGGRKNVQLRKFAALRNIADSSDTDANPARQSIQNESKLRLKHWLKQYRLIFETEELGSNIIAQNDLDNEKECID